MAEKLRHFYEKILHFLRVRSFVAGLEISDEVLRLAYFDGRLWQMRAIRLGPGVMEQGKMKDREAFSSALRELKTAARFGGSVTTHKLGVVVSLSSVTPYSQVFSLPAIEDGDLEKAVALNMAMVSPGSAAETYAGWQVVSRDDATFRLEVLAAFIDRALVDDVVNELASAGFVAVAIESRSLALARVLREKGAGIDIKKAYLMVSVDNGGLDFLVIRNGELYFEYQNSWHDIAGDKGEIPMAKFEEELSGSLRRVLNFSGQHWPDPVSAVIISASAFQAEIEKTIAGNFSLPVLRMTLEIGQMISPEWLVALGCSLREARHQHTAREITLSGDDLEDRFHEEEGLHFAAFWRVAVPMSLGILVVLFAITDGFFGQAKKMTESSANISVAVGSSAEITQLEASMTQFNDSVAMLQTIEAGLSPEGPIIAAVQAHAAADAISISRLTVESPGAPISLSAVAGTTNDVTAFKSDISDDPDFSNVISPLESVQPSGAGYSFTMTFNYTGK